MSLAVALVLAVVLGAAVVSSLADRWAVPAPPLLVLTGLAVSAVPGAPAVQLDPQIVLVLVLPPLLYSGALGASLLDIRANARPIALLSVGLVLFTGAVVALVAYLLVPGLPLGAAFALGAVVGPPDAVAAIAIGRRVGMPARLQTLIEGEGLLNDATALVTYQVAVAAVVGGGLTLLQVGGRFVLASIGGLLVGLLVAALVKLVRRRLDEPLVENTLSLATPFLAYLPAEQLHASGVLAVVVCGLVLGHQSPSLVSSGSRLQSTAVWRLIDFVLEGAVFIVIGLQLPRIVGALGAYSLAELAGWSAAVVAAVVVVRPLWIYPATYLPRWLSRRIRRSDPAPSWREPAALSWAGMRGVVSLAAAFALPLRTGAGQAFPQRDLLLFLAFVVVLATLLLQSLSFGTVLRRLGLRPDRQAVLLQQAGARQAAVSAALRRLEAEAEAEPPPDGIVDELHDMATARVNAGWERLAEVRAGSTGTGRDSEDRETPSAAWRRLRAAMLDAERQELVALRDRGDLSDVALRELQRELDLEEAALLRR